MKTKNKQIIKKIFLILITIIVSLVLTYFISDVKNNAVDRTFNTTNMLAFIGFTLALFVFVNDKSAKLRESVDNRTCKDVARQRSFSKIEGCYKEISDDLRFLFISMVAIFVFEILGDVLNCINLELDIWYGTVTTISVLFFFKCIVTILSLYAIYDVFVATLKLGQITIETNKSKQS